MLPSPSESSISLSIKLSSSGLIGSDPPIRLNSASNSDLVILPSPSASIIGNAYTNSCCTSAEISDDSSDDIS
ncbi:hypothetical protein L1987_07289 [Smallanthus sonchifolius]|uniref:Uncharacterized protein n=1 Tax=Smallanthus sonchifolius TaxID=185202 RepID=A0ACB9K0H0_9ASTR|nr:hypothetical protein L1987_07289 [Smallanthus sonchifolius]